MVVSFLKVIISMTGGISMTMTRQNYIASSAKDRMIWRYTAARDWDTMAMFCLKCLPLKLMMRIWQGRTAAPMITSDT